MNAGGAETFLMKIYRKLDKSQFQMDFCVSSEKKGMYDDEIMSMGGEILYTVPKSEQPLKSFLSIKRIVKENEYHYVLRIAQHSLATLDLLAAKLGGAQTLIFRASNSTTCGKVISEITHKIFRFMCRTIPNVKIAPSENTAIFVFGGKAVKNQEVLLLNNAIDIDKFVFCEKKRIKYRSQLNLNNKLVIGHVGRFFEQKNHDYLIDIFYEVRLIKEDVILLLIGDGDLKDRVRGKVEQLGLSENVLFLGVRSDIPDIMMAMDIFLFPSLFEGMPNVIIEAQATGLPCFVSNTITRECNITNLINFISISISPKEWAEDILKTRIKHRLDTKNIFFKKKYDIDSSTSLFVHSIFK